MYSWLQKKTETVRIKLTHFTIFFKVSKLLTVGFKKKRELSEKFLSDFIKFLYSLFFNQRTTTPQFTPKTELTTLYTFDLG
jgi:hypothetical protein